MAGHRAVLISHLRHRRGDGKLFFRMHKTAGTRFPIIPETETAFFLRARVRNVRNGTSSGADSAKRTMGKPRRGAVHNTRAPRPRVRRGFPINPSRIVPIPCWQRSVASRLNHGKCRPAQHRGTGRAAAGRHGALGV